MTRQRALLRETGTAHLMAISGMHIALAASVGWLLARVIQLVLPARRIGYLMPLLISGLTAAAYCWISGSHPPAQRAMLALTLWLATRIAGWQLSNWQVWTLCVGSLLWLDPLTVLSESFWLSALAVAMLILWFQWFPLPPRFRQPRRWLLLRLLHLQLGMMILMAPLQIFLFHGLSLSALVANPAGGAGSVADYRAVDSAGDAVAAACNRRSALAAGRSVGQPGDAGAGARRLVALERYAAGGAAALGRAGAVAQRLAREGADALRAVALAVVLAQ